MIRCILIFLMFVFFNSCKESIPSGVVGPGEMQKVLWDVMRADALSQLLVKNDSSKTLAGESRRLRSQALLIHKITEAQFVSSYAYYSQHPNILKAVLDSINSQQIRMSTIEIPVEKTRAKDSTGK